MGRPEDAADAAGCLATLPPGWISGKFLLIASPPTRTPSQWLGAPPAYGERVLVLSKQGQP